MSTRPPVPISDWEPIAPSFTAGRGASVPVSDWEPIGPAQPGMFDFIRGQGTETVRRLGAGDVGGALSLMGSNAADVATGFAQEAGGRLLDLGDFLRRHSAAGAIAGRESMAGGTRAAFPQLQQTTPGQQLGAMAERVGEYALPAAAATRATAALANAPRVARAVSSAIEGAGTAGVAAGQGGDAGDVALAGTLGAVTGPTGALITKGASAAKGFVTEKLAPRLINSLVKPVSKAFEFGKNPGRGVSAEGITANNLDDLGTKVWAKVKEAGERIDKHLSMPLYQAKKVDVLPALQPLRDAIAKAVKEGEDTLLGRLRELEKRILHDFKEVPKKGGGSELVVDKAKATTVSPLEAARMKRDIGEKTKWREGDPYSDEVNGIRVAVYRELNDLIEKAAPGTRSFNARYADLLTAAKAIERRSKIQQRLDMVGLTPTLGAIAGYAGSLATGNQQLESALIGLGSMLGTKALGTTALKTRVASALARLDPEQRALLDRALPLLRALYLGGTSAEDRQTSPTR